MREIGRKRGREGERKEEEEEGEEEEEEEQEEVEEEKGRGEGREGKGDRKRASLHFVLSHTWRGTGSLPYAPSIFSLCKLLSRCDLH